MRGLVLVLALACLPSTAQARDLGQLRIGARVGVFVPQVLSSLETSFLVGANIDWTPPVWKRRFALALDGSLTAPEASGRATAPSLPSEASYRVRARTAGVGLAVVYRHTLGRFAPYAALGVRLMIVDTLIDGAAGSARFPSARERSVDAGLTVQIGVGLRLGAGELLLEVPFYYAPVEQRALGAFSAGGLGVTVGYAVVF